jgi:tetratricopeptide (TPR) repeat protein
MGKKKKKGKKRGQRETSQQMQDLSLVQLIQMAKNELSSGNSRQAISVLKYAGKKHGFTAEINQWLFRSYVSRYEELRRKGLDAEADAVRILALDYVENFKTISEEEMKICIALCSDTQAFEAYAHYLETRPRSPEIERRLANHLFRNQKWELTARLDPSSSLALGAPVIQQAIPLMDEGKWEEALNMLQPISRTSPYAPIRMFCRAMAAFYNDDTAEARAALSAIPDDFPLSRVAADLKVFVSESEGKAGQSQDLSRLSCLWEGSVNLDQDIRDMITALNQKQIKKIIHSICKVADAIYPQDTETARAFILQVLSAAEGLNKMRPDDFDRLVAGVLSEKHSRVLMMKAKLMSGLKPISSTGEYISNYLQDEFPDPDDRNIAQSQILFHQVSLTHKLNDLDYMKEDRAAIKKYGKILGINSENPESILLDMTAECIRLDPFFRDAYELIVILPRYSRPDKKTVETALTTMLQHFPDDPFPCLELATLHYESNAFRKAETILEEAMRRAPHDNRVIDRHVLSLLISVDKNIHRNKPHLVERDIERAKSLGSKKMVPFISEKQIILKLIRAEEIHTEPGLVQQFSLFGPAIDLNGLMEEDISRMPMFDQLLVLSLLISDVGRHKFPQVKSVLKSLNKIFGKKMKSADALPSADLVRLLTPLGRDYKSILPEQNIARIVLNAQNVLDRIENKDIIPLYDLIYERSLSKIIHADVKKRVKTARGRDRLMLDFCSAVIEHLSGGFKPPASFFNVVKQADTPALEEELRVLSRKWARHAAGQLKTALERFNFELLMDNIFFPDLDDEDDFPLPFPIPSAKKSQGGGMPGGLEDLLDIVGGMDTVAMDEEDAENLLDLAEDMVDEFHVRGFPDIIIKEARGFMRGDSQMRIMMDTLGKIIERSGMRGELSREAQIILYGKFSKKKK